MGDGSTRAGAVNHSPGHPVTPNPGVAPQAGGCTPDLLDSRNTSHNDADTSIRSPGDECISKQGRWQLLGGGFDDKGDGEEGESVLDHQGAFDQGDDGVEAMSAMTKPPRSPQWGRW